MSVHVGSRLLHREQPRSPGEMSGRDEQKARALGITSFTGLTSSVTSSASSPRLS